MDNSTIAIGQRRELFVDALLIERLEQARRVLHRPQPREIAISFHFSSINVNVSGMLSEFIFRIS